MTPRELCYNILHYKPAERLPAVRFGYWPDLLREWADQGHITHEQASHRFVAEAELDRLIGWDFPWYCTTASHMGLYPPFEQKELETLPDGLTLVRIKLHTGRTHQIRIQFASRGCPVAGDGKYGSRVKCPFIALWSHRLTFVNPVTGNTVSAESTPPADTEPWGRFWGVNCCLAEDDHGGEAATKTFPFGEGGPSKGWWMR